MTSSELREAPPPLPRKRGALVVDDDAGVRNLLNVVLRRQGFVTWLAAHGQEALDLYREHRRAIDVVLLDVRMPVLDGPRTLGALREVDPGVRCCFMSGDLGRYSEADLYDLGAAAVVRKPFRLEDVAHALRELTSDVGIQSSAT